MPRFRVLSALAALLVASPARAQASNPGAAAEAVARAAFRALEERRWGDVASLVHPEALRRFHTGQVQTARAAEHHRGEQAPRPHDPEMPEAVAQWFAERSRKYEESHPFPLQREFGVASVAELEALPAHEMFTRWIRARDPREAMLAELAAQGNPLPPDAVAQLPTLGETRAVVGSVVEDDSTVQVLYRRKLTVQEAGDGPMGLGIATVRHSPEGWRLWSTERDSPFLSEADVILSWELGEEVEQRLVEAKDNVVSWPAGAVPAGRAFVTGYPGGTRPPKALVVEVPDRNGAPTRVEVPASVFEEVMEKLLAPWTGLEEEPAGAPARP